MAVDRIHPNLPSCIRSILQQDINGLEFLICLDIGDLEIKKRLENICVGYTGVKIFQNPHRKGLAFSLNKLIRISRGDLIIRMDDDDISTEFRLQELVDAHTKYTESLIIGSCAMSMKNENKAISVPLSFSEIKCLPINKTRFLHPTVSFKRKFFGIVGFYDTKFNRLQDKDLWERACLHEIEFRNLTKQLLHYNDFHSQKSFATLFDRWISKFLFCNKYQIRNKGTILLKTIMVDLYHKIR